MTPRSLGASGIDVSPIGLGAGALGDARLGERDAEALLAAALDEGVTLIDTARSYGLSEERIGRHVGAHPSRRARAVIATKGGYGVDGVDDWTPAAIERGIDDALRRLQTDRIDVFHFHSCPLDVAIRDDLFAPLDAARAAGKIRCAAYSGDNDALAWAVASGRFGSVECSVNVFDQRAIDGAIADASARGVGVVGKRALGNAPWRFAERPHGDYCESYWLRMRAMEIDPSPLAWDELAIRFAAFAPGVSAILVGTASVEHLRENLRHVAKGTLPDDVVARARAAFSVNDRDWRGEI
jgi:aryl-alcohol dehydrogenase-like predicted oxidoreductase